MKPIKQIVSKIIHIYKRIFWTNEKYARHIGVTIGRDCDIQDVVFGSEPYLIEIGNHVQITNGTKIFTHGAAWVLRNKYPNIDFFGKVVINDNVYIGNNSLIMPGVTIGKNVIIAAGSVVTKSVPENSIVGGNPAKVISNLSDFEKKIMQFDLGTKGLTSRQKKALLLSTPPNAFLKK